MRCGPKNAITVMAYEGSLMYIIYVIVTSLLAVTSLHITEPESMASYNLDELPGLRIIVENENEIPDSIRYSLNGNDFITVSRLSTDWPTYMQNIEKHGYSESPAPVDDTVLWVFPIADPNSHEFPTPVVVDGIVYYPQDHGGDSLFALDAASGELIWKYCVGTNDDAVTVQDGKLFAASDSIFCLDALSGERIWANGDADWTGSTPVVVDGRVYCGTGPYPPGSGPNISYISCLDESDGSNIWTVPLDSCALYSCMTVWNQFVFVPTWRDAGETSLYALDSTTGDIIWENDDSYEGYWDSSPVLVDSVIYINGCDGYARGIDAVSGSTIWSKFTYPATATPAYHDGRLYFATELNMYYFCLDALSGGTIWQTPGKQHGSSAVADGQVIYGNYSMGENVGIRSLNSETGVEIWSHFIEGATWVQGSPSVTDGVVYMPLPDGNLYAFGTGLKYTYADEQLNSPVGLNELIANSYDNGTVTASDTISYYINQTGIEFGPSMELKLAASPNPMSSSARVAFILPECGRTIIRVFDLSGREIVTLADSDFSGGSHSLIWNAVDSTGQGISSGLYLCRIEHNGIIETTGLCVLR